MSPHHLHKASPPYKNCNFVIKNDKTDFFDSRAKSPKPKTGIYWRQSKFSTLNYPCHKCLLMPRSHMNVELKMNLTAWAI